MANTKKCEVCGKEFKYERSTARFCSSTCRARNGGNKKAGESGRLRMPDNVRFSVLRRDKFQCRFCGAKPAARKLRVDHVVPISEGGAKLDPNNLITTCHSCNSGKGALVLKASEIPDGPE